MQKRPPAFSACQTSESFTNVPSISTLSSNSGGREYPKAPRRDIILFRADKRESPGLLQARTSELSGSRQR